MRVLVTLGVVVVVAVGILWLGQRRLIYFPSGSPGPPPPGWEPVTLATSDGLDLAAWVWEPRGDAAVVIVFNGNAGNRGDRLGLGDALAGHGLGVILFDYRGYGGNPGSPTEDGLANDAQAVADWVRVRYPGRPMVYFGESLGAAVAVDLAVRQPPDAIVLRSPFTSLADVSGVHYPLLPAELLLWDEYPSLDRIADVAVPTVVIAGSADSIIPPEQSRAIHDAAPGPTTWVRIDGADHNDAALVQGPAVIAAVVNLAGRSGSSN